jgi:hypothetical protein
MSVLTTNLECRRSGRLSILDLVANFIILYVLTLSKLV